MSEANVAERLKNFIENKGLSYSQFADACGIPRPSLSQLLTGRNKKINDIMVRQIHNQFPDLSVVWLLFGEGPMEVGLTANQQNDRVIRNDIFDETAFIDDTLDNSESKKIIFSPSGQSLVENAREIGPKATQNTAKIADYKADKLQQIVKELQGQIDNFKKNPRKAIRITVYYDDSTFEEFAPSRE